MTKAVIIDANVFSRTMQSEIAEAIASDDLKVVMSKGGELDKELKKACLERYIAYDKAGRFYSVCNRSVKKKQKSINDNASIQSNDSHIVALAIVACANTLFTNEKDNLIRDFKDVRKINRDAGCIENNRLRSSGHQKVIRQQSTPKREVKRLIEKAEAEGFRCECIINGGGC